MRGVQLPLGVELRESAGFDNYYAGPNAEAVAALRDLPASAVTQVLVHGPGGSGKTHLLQALTRSCAGRGSVAYLPLRALSAEPAEALSGFDAADLVCVDDLEAAADPQLGLALLRLLDALRTHGGRCALSAAAPPERLGLVPDLVTRLSAAARYALRPLTDLDREHLLRGRARARGLELPEDAARLLLARLPRGTGSLLQALDELDRASLSAQRRLTVPFVQQWLQQHHATG